MTDETKEDRNCANCACSFTQVSNVAGVDHQLFCRRDPVQAAKIRTTVPAVNSKGEPLFLRDGKTLRTQEVEQLGFLYRPVIATTVCFDGWRPLGTLPGDKWQNAQIDDQIERMVKGYARLMTDIQNDSLRSLLDNECPHGQTAGGPCPNCPDGIAVGVVLSAN